jgi:predicted nucleic acid-binding protein
MYLLDTTVVSENRKMRGGSADKNVVRWMDSVSPATTLISVYTVFELELGIKLKERQDSAQGEMLRRWFQGSVLHHFEDRILAPDQSIVCRCAALHVPNPVSERDGWIAAIALQHGMTVVTRNTSDFESTGVTRLNPWH